MASKVDIKYINKDFSSFKSDLVEFARAYYPTVYNDFTVASPGTMFIDMASYVGDVLSFYLDNQIQETFLQYAKQKGNLFNIAYMMGYRPKMTSVAIAELDVYQQVPSLNVGGSYVPDFNYALVIQPGMVVKSSVNPSSYFYCPEKVDFTLSSSMDPTEVSVYTVNGSSVPTRFLLKKSTYAVSGELRTKTFSFAAAQRFNTINIQDTDIVGIVSAVDSDGNSWAEVPYLAQDYILNPVQNTQANYPSLYQYANQVPYILQKVKVPRRFVSRFRTNESLDIEFGPGVNSVADTSIIPNPNNVGLGTVNSPTTFISSAFDPTNFVTTQTYGLAPYNTSITFTYLAGGGATSNAQSNELTLPVSFTATGVNTSLQNTVVTNNENPATGGADGDDVESIRLNTAAEFASQLRAVTQQDYLIRTLNMPQKYGRVSKAFVTKDDTTFTNYLMSDVSEKDPVLVSLYILSYNDQGQLTVPSEALMQNLDTYLSEYRMLTDAVNIKPAYIINVQVDFEIVTRPNYSGMDVLTRCVQAMKDYFDVSKWEINQPIILSNVYSSLDIIEGVQTVKSVRISNLSGESNGYSKYGYDIQAGTLNGVIYPSLDPSIFEVKYPDLDVRGRIVTV
ncbi:MAG: hypothetical protein EB120_02105 [Proteobacteria bacterium]|nr:hypothetical protein [Pseudomonadota bacterium]